MLSTLIAIALPVTLISACARPVEPAELAVLVSDHRDAIGDFARLETTIEQISLHSVDTQEWLELDPQSTVVDLTQLIGNEFEQVLKRSIPSGRYDAIKVDLTGALGTLHTGEEIALDGMSSSARLEFQAGSNQSVAVLVDLKVQSQHDHPGGGYVLLLSEVRLVPQSSTE